MNDTYDWVLFVAGYDTPWFSACLVYLLAFQAFEGERMGTHHEELWRSSPMFESTKQGQAVCCAPAWCSWTTRLAGAVEIDEDDKSNGPLAFASRNDCSRSEKRNGKAQLCCVCFWLLRKMVVV